MHLNKSMLWLIIAFISLGIILILFDKHLIPVSFILFFTGMVIAVVMGIFALIRRRPVTTLEMAGSLVSIGILCLLSFALIGSTVDEQGVLHEPFFLIQLGLTWIFISIIMGITHLFLKK